MAELSAVNVKITGDASGLTAAANTAKKSMAGVGTAAANVNKQTAKLGGVTKNTSNQIRMMGMQLSQVGQQTMAGGGFLRALAIQLPDIGLAFGTVGIAAGLLAGIALPLLGEAFADTGDAAKDAEEEAKRLATAFTTLGSMSAAIGDDIEKNITSVFLDQADAVRELLAALRERQMAEAMDAIRDNLNNVTGDVDKLVVAWDVLLSALETPPTDVVGQAHLKSMEDLFFSSQLTLDEILQLKTALDAIGEAESQKELIAKMAEARDLAAELGGPVGDAVVDALIEMAEKAGILDGILASAKGNAAGISTNLGGRGGDPRQFDHRDEFRKQLEDAGKTKPGKRRGRSDSTERELEQLRKRLADETELINQTHLDQQETLYNALEQKLITQEEFQTLMQQSAQAHADAMLNIDRAQQQSTLQAWGGALGDLSSLMMTENKKLFKIGQAAALAKAVVDGYSAAVTAWGHGMAIGGPGVAAAFTAMSLAKTGALISSIKGASMGGGGAVGGGGGVGGGAAPARSAANIDLSLVGGDLFSRDQVVDLIGKINEAQEDGAVVRLV